MPLSQTPRATISVALRRHRAHNRGRRKIKIPIAFAAQPGRNFPRLHALALFGRLSAQRAQTLVIASVQKPAQQRTFRIIRARCRFWSIPVRRRIEGLR